MWSELKTIVVAADVMSAAAVLQFFYMKKLEAYLRRATAGSIKVTMCSVVGKLLSSLQAHSIYTVNRTDIHPSLNYQNQRDGGVGMS
jgi:hypothetical protein